MKVCKNCGCPPPAKGEIGIYCSACGAEAVYITINPTTGDVMPKVTLFNTSILTDFGSYRYEPLTLEEARTVAVTCNAESAIGHQATAEILTELLGIEVAVNRTNHKQTVDDLVVVFKLRGRPEEGKILSRQEIDAIGYDFGLLTKLS